MTFDSIVPEGRKGRADETMFRSATEAARRFAENPDGWLVLEGTTGAGKTHLAAAIVNALIERGAPAKYISALDLPDLIRDERFDDTHGVSAFESLISAPILVIDDLGAQQSANWVEAKLDQLLTHRFNARMPTIIVLAKPVAELPERIALKLDDPALSHIIPLSSLSNASRDLAGKIPTSMLERMTFDKFEPNGALAATHTDRDSLVSAYADARDFAEKPQKWLYLHGPTGVGKTHLAVAIANVQLKNGNPFAFWTAPDLLDNLRNTYANPDETAFFSMFEAIRNSPLLILDDFGAQHMTDWSLEKIYQLVTYRHDRLLPTVITSQYILWDRADNSQFGRIHGKQQWEAIRSRLKDSSVVSERLMAAPDFRNRGG